MNTGFDYIQNLYLFLIIDLNFITRLKIVFRAKLVHNSVQNNGDKAVWG